MRLRGQTLVLFMLTTLLLTLMVMMTLSIGSKVRDRIELQTLADASAYSNAVATARSFNTAALLNRTMVSQWAAMCGIAALHSWGSSQNGYYYGFAAAVMELNDPNPAYQWDGIDKDDTDGIGKRTVVPTCKDGNGYYACHGRWADDPDPGPNCGAQGPATCASASAVNSRGQLRRCSPSWDTSVSPAQFSCNGPPPDCDELRRRHIAAEAVTLWSQGDTQWGRGFGALDQGVIDQTKNLWQAMDDLGRIQVKTQERLRDALRDQELAVELVTLSGSREPITVLKGAQNSNVAKREVEAAAPLQKTTEPPAPDAHMRAMAQAVMGTRRERLLHYRYPPPAAFADFMQRSGRGNGAAFPVGNGATLRYTWDPFLRVTAHPGTYGQGRVNPYAQSLRSQPSVANPDQRNNNPIDNNQMDEAYSDDADPANAGLITISPGTASGWRGPAINRDWTGVRASSWMGRLRVEYSPATSGTAANATCVPGFGAGADGRVNVGEGMSLVWYTVPVGPEVPRHYATGHHPSRDEVQGHRAAFWAGPQSYVANHPGELSSDLHVIGNSNTDNSVMPYSIGFVFPHLGKTGANGAWGQPKTPVLLQKPLTHKDPWHLIAGMQFSTSSAGTQVNLSKVEGPAALGNAIAYFHRTSNGGAAGGWIEAPSFLNPFWRATLVPIDIDERPQGAGVNQDNTPAYAYTGNTVPDAPLMLRALGLTDEAKVYTDLTAAGWRGGQ